jgi:DUF4097 and DUF4098 domain-containing protein YvlB
MRLGIVLVIAGVLLFFATTPSSAWLTRGAKVVSEVGTRIDGRWERSSKSVTQTYDLSSINTLQLETFSGEIKIQVSDTMTSQGAFYLEAIGHRQLPEVVRDGTTLSIKASRQPCNNCALHYNVKLGKAMNLELKAANGLVRVVGLTNSVQIQNQNGEIELENLGKTSLQLENQNGATTVRNAQLEPGSQNRIQNQNGEIELENISSSGGLEIQTSAQNGDINNEIGNTPGENPAQLELSTQNGGISLTAAR